jgi:hypothetical protein
LGINRPQSAQKSAKHDHGENTINTIGSACDGKLFHFSLLFSDEFGKNLAQLL